MKDQRSTLTLGGVFIAIISRLNKLISVMTLASTALKNSTFQMFPETDNKSTQTDDSFTQYLKQQTQEKQQEPSEEKPQEKGNPSRPGQTLKPATLEMMRKEGEKKKKEEKDKLKKQQKDERQQQYHKEKAQKDKEEAEKAIQAQKNPFSVFKRMMRKMTLRMILWFSQTLPPVITSLKAHFHDYQQLKQWKVSI